MTLLIALTLVAIAGLACALLYRRKSRFQRLLEESIKRQVAHEMEYPHMGGVTTALRLETIVRRVENKLRARGVRSPRDLRRKVWEAMCPPGS